MLASGGKVDAYVARTDPNMGVTTGAKRSFFVDPIWERTRSAAASCTFVNGEFDNTGSLVSAFRHSNGIATAEDNSVHVAGGYVLLDGHQSTYSSAGPSRDYPTHTSSSVRTTCCHATSPTLFGAFVPEAPGAAACFV